MLKKILTSLVLSLTLITSFIGTKLYLNSQDYSYPRSVVYSIEGPYGSGSGVMIADNLMVTAFHVVGEEALEMRVNGKPVKVLKFDKAKDIALLEVQVSCPCIPLSLELPDTDKKVIAVGYPLGVGKVVSEGRYMHIHEGKMLTNLSITFGNSGGGLFMWNGYHWVLVGVTVQIAGTSLGFIGIPVFHISSSVTARDIHNLITNDVPPK